MPRGMTLSPPAAQMRAMLDCSGVRFAQVLWPMARTSASATLYSGLPKLGGATGRNYVDDDIAQGVTCANC